MDEDFSSGSLSSTFWQTESSIGGGTGNDFVWYSDDSANSFIADGALNIVPSLTSAATNLQYGIRNTTYLDLGQYCTVSTPENCILSSSANSSITVPPVRSASITTRNKVSMKYGRVEITAKMPTGDWLWPRISLVPANDVYGSYPASGLIDVSPPPSYALPLTPLADDRLCLPVDRPEQGQPRYQADGRPQQRHPVWYPLGSRGTSRLRQVLAH